MSSVLRRTAQLYRSYWKEGALCVLLQLVLRLMAFAPLVFLSSHHTQALALLCIPLYVLIVLPARQNMAIAMQSAVNGGPLFSVQLVSTRDYGKKVLRGLKRAGLLLLWGSLWLAATVWALTIYFGDTDVFTVIRMVMTLGGGSTIQGIKILLLIYAATLLPLLMGVAFHSGARHGEALGSAALVRKHRGGLILCWLLGLVVFIPFLAVTAWVSADLVSALTQMLSNFGGNMVLPPMGEKLTIILTAFVVLLLPLLPLKQLLPAVYLSHIKESGQ